jgi:hypothetical protein
VQGYFAFQDSSSAGPTLVVFVSTTTPTSLDLDELLQSYMQDHAAPEKVLLIGAEGRRSQLETAAQGDFGERLAALTGSGSENGRCATSTFDRTGRLTGVGEEAAKKLRRSGLLRLFETRGAMVTAPSGAHFVKPSGKHCSRFIRAGNVVVNGSELEFLAMCCLPYVPAAARNIYCDTGSIVAIGMAISSLLRTFGEGGAAPHVESFGSYEGLQSFSLREPERSLVLISASTSGELLSKIVGCTPELPAAQVVTLFGVGDWTKTQQVVCDLAPEHETITSEDPDACDQCKAGSVQVPMLGEQFLPMRSTVRGHLIKADQMPSWLRAFMEQFVGTRTLRANFRDASGSEVREIFIDLKGIFADAKLDQLPLLSERFDRTINQELPLGVRRIVTLNNESSKALGTLVQNRCNEHRRAVSLVTASDLEQNVDEHELAEGATVVVASAIATGRSLLSVSQTLRRSQKNRAIVYIVGMSRTSGPAQLKEVRGNVTYEVTGLPFRFHTLQDVFLPEQSSGRETIWEQERAFIKRLQESAPPAELASRIEHRLELLDKSSGQDVRGLVDDLFWPSLKGTALALRPGFALWPFDYSSKGPSQADVFFTMLALLHWLRTQGPTTDRLGSQPHSHSAIAPECFDRFNDGIVQAALLRAAGPLELNYGASEVMSSKMLDIITACFENAESDAGEAAIEFAIALGMRRLVLAPTVAAQLKKQCEGGKFTEILAALVMAGLKGGN